ncbi:MAG: hypothetical protein HFACDABA_01393 [Anaerolineales bacterium]|nr:hypothetical protein [Anaerolineales bacterium]
MLNRLRLPLILALAAFIRSMGITSRPIWYDEAFSILFSLKGPAAMLYGTLAPATGGSADIHPLGYYTLLWAWMQMFGSSLVAARSLSILAGVAIVALAYLLTRELFDERLAGLAAVFVALAPFPVHYSQEIRMYSFLALWLILSTYAYERGAKGGGIKWWLLFSISAALAQYTHNLAAFFLLPLAATPLLRRDWKSLRAVALAGSGALLLYLPWLIQLPAQLAKVSTAYWVERPGAEKIFTLLLVYVTNLPLPDALLFAGLFIALTVFVIAARQAFRRSNRNADALWLLYLAFAPPILLFLVSQWTPVYIERALLPSGTIFCIWLAWAVFETQLPNVIRNGVVSLLILASALGLYQHVTYLGFPYAPFAELDKYLRRQSAPEDLILHSSKFTMLPAVYHDPSLPQSYLADTPGSRADTLAPPTQQVLGLMAQPDLPSAVGSARRVWFVIFERSIQEYLEAGESAHPQLAWMNSHYSLIEIQTWGDLRVYLFSTP